MTNRAESPNLPVLTGLLLAVNVGIYILQLTRPGFTAEYALIPALVEAEPHRLITGAFLHSTASPLHIIGNMATLWIVGRSLERWTGSLIFGAIYAVSLVFGSLGAILLTPDPDTVIVGASGAIYGILGAVLILRAALRQNPLGDFALILGNLALGFIAPGISWQAHLGGLIGGLISGLVFIPAKRAIQVRRERKQVGYNSTQRSW